jgi:hypothetical protein
MKTLLLFLALTLAAQLEWNKLYAADQLADTSKATFVSGTTATLAYQQPLNLTISAGKGYIAIDFKTGQVTLPKDMTLPDAAVAFWLKVAQAFPECREAMLTGDPTPLTTEWTKLRLSGENIQDPYFPVSAYLHTIELGLRSDGVVVWREVKP